MKILLFLFCLITPFSIVNAVPSTKERVDLNHFFNKEKVKGVIVIYDTKTEETIVSDKARAEVQYVPASTFKIQNSLIGLETGAVESINEIFPYDGQPRFLKTWEKDMDLREAIKVSCVPVYQEIARRVGLQKMDEMVKAFEYGNQQIGTVVDQFWLRGPLKISAIEQTEFLSRLAQGKLPVKADNLAALKEIAQLEKTDKYTLYGKTGWLKTDVKPDIGWWVGWVEKDNHIYTVALNIDMLSEQDAPKRLLIAKECLKSLGIL
jgi:beta-lactamase class D